MSHDFVFPLGNGYSNQGSSIDLQRIPPAEVNRAERKLRAQTHARRIGGYLDALLSPTKNPRHLSPLEKFFSKHPEKKISQAVDRLSHSHRRKLAEILDPAVLNEILSVAEGANSKKFLKELHRIALELRKAGKFSASAQLFEKIITWSESSLGSPGSGGDFTAIAQEARKGLADMTGQGDGAGRLNFLAEHFLDELFDGWALAGYGVARTTGKFIRLKKLDQLIRPLSTLGVSARPPQVGALRSLLGERTLASAWGLSAESAVFVLTTKTGRHLSGTPQDFRPLTLAKDTLGMGIFLGSFHIAGAATRRWLNAVYKIDPYLMARPIPLPWSVRAQQILLPQVAMYGALGVNHIIQRTLGWADPKAPDIVAVDNFVELLHLNAFGFLAEHLRPARWRALEKKLDFDAEMLARSRRNARPPWNFFPKWNYRVALPGGGTLEFLPGEGVAEHEGLRVYAKDRGNGDGKVIRLPGSLPPSSLPEGRPPMPSRGEALEAAQRGFENARKLLTDLKEDLTEIGNAAQIVLRHLQLGRERDPDFIFSQVQVGKQAGTFEKNLMGAEDIRPHLDTFLLVTKDPESLLFRDLESLRKEYRAFFKQREPLNDAIRKILFGASSADPVAIKSGLDRLKYLFENYLVSGPQGTAVSRTNVLHIPRPLHAASGILIGMGVKEIFRLDQNDFNLHLPQSRVTGFELDPNSPRRRDLEFVEDLLHRLYTAEPDQSYLGLLTHTRFEGRERKALNQLGSQDAPFQTWLSLYVPSLMLLLRGSYSKYLARTADFDPHFDPYTRVTHRMAAWWISQAMGGSGNPKAWVEEGPPDLRDNLVAREILQKVATLAGREGLNPEMTRPILGTRGGKAIVSHALLAFVRSSFDARRGLQWALKSPKGIREDVLTLTAALFGAFHGGAIFSGRNLRQWWGEWYPRHGVRQDEGGLWDKTQQKYSKIVGVLAKIETAWKWEEPERPPAPVITLKTPLLPPKNYPPGTVTLLRPDLSLDPVVKTYENAYQNSHRRLRFLVLDTAGFLRRSQGTGLVDRDLGGLLERVNEQLGDLDRQRKELVLVLREVERFWPDAKSLVKKNYPGKIEDILEGVEATIRDLEQIMLVMEYYQGNEGERISPSQYSQAQIALERLRDRQSMREELGLAPQSHRSYDASAIRALYDGAVYQVGPALSPRTDANIRLNLRGDWEIVQELIQEFSSRDPSEAKIRDIFNRYLEIVKTPWRLHGFDPAVSHRITPSAMISILTPAYLGLHQANPQRAYRELESEKFYEDHQNRDMWRGVTHLALRLLTGAEPNPFLVIDTGQSFEIRKDSAELRTSLQPTPVGKAFMKLGNFQLRRKKDPQLLIDLLETIKRSEVPFYHALIGIHAFMEHPMSLVKAVALAKKYENWEEPNRLAIRVAGLLTRAHQSTFHRPPSPEGSSVVRVDFQNGK